MGWSALIWGSLQGDSPPNIQPHLAPISQPERRVLGAAASVVHIASQLDGDLREEEGLVEDQQANTAGIPFAQPDDEDEWMSYVDLGDIEASWPSGTSWPSSSGDV